MFFTNSGSEPNDTVLKLIAYQSNALGQSRRKKVISRLRGHHGVTIGAASLTGFRTTTALWICRWLTFCTRAPPIFYGRAGEPEEIFAARRADELKASFWSE